jgi:predicted MPP superfamily phosphohydrolase
MGRHFPQWIFLSMVAWIIGQLWIFLLAPVIIFLPTQSPLYTLVPIGVLIFVFITVFRSAHRVVEQSVKLQFDHLPESWTPLKILHLSDIHSGPFMRHQNLQKVVDRLNHQDFDLCLITGDVVNHSHKELHWTLELLEKLTPRLGSFAVMGNHEYIDDEKAIFSDYKKSKIDLIFESSRFISRGPHKIRLIGVDYPFEKGATSKTEIEAAMEKSSDTAVDSSEFQILLSHHPNGFEVAKKMGIPLTLAGHTHGGQIRLGKKNLLNRFAKYVRGLYQEGTSYLYVSSGLGNWMPFRINVPCEFAVLTIERGEAR